jgi:hypothetical protein
VRDDDVLMSKQERNRLEEFSMVKVWCFVCFGEVVEFCNTVCVSVQFKVM